MATLTHPILQEYYTTPLDQNQVSREVFVKAVGMELARIIGLCSKGWMLKMLLMVQKSCLGYLPYQLVISSNSIIT